MESRDNLRRPSAWPWWVRLLIAVQLLVLFAVVPSAPGLSAFPSLEQSLLQSDTVVIGTTVGEPRRVGVVYLSEVNSNDYTWREHRSTTTTTNVLAALTAMAERYASENKTDEGLVLDSILSRYFWVWETTVSVSNVLRGTVATNMIVVRQMFPYAGTLMNATITEKLLKHTTYVMFLKVRESGGQRVVCELPFFHLALPVAARYEVFVLFPGREALVVSHADLLKLVGEGTFTHQRFLSLLKPVPDKKD